MELAQETRDQLTDHLNAGGALKHSTDSEKGDFSRRAGETLQMIATTSEFHSVSKSLKTLKKFSGSGQRRRNKMVSTVKTRYWQ
ncbi:MAG: hypothetical protein CM1200mP27_10180 [Chloroflexota bacterium]|nr:MAG: hypothetical protein CM1200mP27_10180 [Chloroflexota bacterium]